MHVSSINFPRPTPPRARPPPPHPPSPPHDQPWTMAADAATTVAAIVTAAITIILQSSRCDRRFCMPGTRGILSNTCRDRSNLSGMQQQMLMDLGVDGDHSASSFASHKMFASVVEQKLSSRSSRHNKETMLFVLDHCFGNSVKPLTRRSCSGSRDPSIDSSSGCRWGRHRPCSSSYRVLYLSPQ